MTSTGALAHAFASSPQVTLCPSPTLRILPNPEHDPQEFAGLEGLASHIHSRGFYGGVRILQASRSRRSCCCWLICLPCQWKVKVGSS